MCTLSRSAPAVGFKVETERICEWHLEQRVKFDGDPVVSGFHQNRLESIQDAEGDEQCLPRTDKYKYGGRPLFTSDNLLCARLGSSASKKLKGLRPVPFLPSRSEKPRVQRLGHKEEGTGKSEAQSLCRRARGGLSTAYPAPHRCRAGEKSREHRAMQAPLPHRSLRCAGRTPGPGRPTLPSQPPKAARGMPSGASCPPPFPGEGALPASLPPLPSSERPCGPEGPSRIPPAFPPPSSAARQRLPAGPAAD